MISDRRRIEARIARLTAEGAAFAVATVVRTIAPISVTPGSKAVLDAHGTLIEGWLGGGCARSAVAKATVAAIAGGVPQLVSLRPEDLLDAEGVRAGEERDGVRFARNGCPSRGSMDVFVEPVLPRPRLVICGQGAVAAALAQLTERFDFHRTVCAAGGVGAGFPAVDAVREGFDFAVRNTAPYVVVATQGQGDSAALRGALASGARYIAFVGSRRKYAALADRLVGDGVSRAALERVVAPAGLDIQAITPEEIALSILAQITQVRRSADRGLAIGDDQQNDPKNNAVDDIGREADGLEEVHHQSERDEGRDEREACCDHGIAGE